jgi:hypothetical protein
VEKEPNPNNLAYKKDRAKAPSRWAGEKISAFVIKCFNIDFNIGAYVPSGHDQT